ncbi:MAG: hypothetical protein K8M05_31355 [Deltaproteobacteria bacterium]|nr:hypothetical protein [Kofleriaceae bacterium]
MRACSYVLGSLVAVAACGPSSTGGDGNGDVDGGGGGGPDAPWPTDDGDGGTNADGCEKIDILFVVDNSGSMGQEQTNLATNFPQFLSVIEASGLDYRVAITTTGMDYTYQQATFPGGPVLPISQDGGDNGAMLQPGGCNMTRRWIEKNDANAASAFACAANVGTSGPSDEMPLAAMRTAFEERMADGTNGGFRRQDALLAVVILTDENDCSYEQSVTLGFAESLCDSQAEPPANYSAFLDAYTGDHGRWAVAMIAGPGPGSCSSSFGNADYAERLVQFASAAGPSNALVSSICAGDLTVGLTDALELFDTACDNFPPID